MSEQQTQMDGATPVQTGADIPAGSGTQQRDQQGRFVGADGQAQDQGAAGESITLSKADFEALQSQFRREIQEANDRLEIYRQNVAPQQPQANVFNSGHPNPSAYSNERPYDPNQGQDVFDGLKDDDWVDTKAVKSALNRMQAEYNRRASLSEAKAQAAFYLGANPSAKQEIEQAGVLNDPLLKQTIANSPDPMATAHILAKRILAAGGQQASPGQQQQGGMPQMSADEILKRIMENSSKPGNPGSASGGAPAITAANRIAKMTPAEFAQYKRDVDAGRVKAGQ